MELLNLNLNVKKGHMVFWGKLWCCTALYITKVIWWGNGWALVDPLCGHVLTHAKFGCYVLLHDIHSGPGIMMLLLQQF